MKSATRLTPTLIKQIFTKEEQEFIARNKLEYLPPAWPGQYVSGLWNSQVSVGVSTNPLLNIMLKLSSCILDETPNSISFKGSSFGDYDYPSYNKITLKFDKAGRVILALVENLASGRTVDYFNFVYNDKGQLATTHRRDHNTQISEYDDQGRLSKRHTYFYKNGRTDVEGFEYNDAGKRVFVSTRFGRIRYEYDDKGNRVYTGWPFGDRYYKEYDSNNRVIKEKQLNTTRKDVVKLYTYDSNGNIVKFQSTRTRKSYEHEYQYYPDGQLKAVGNVNIPYIPDTICSRISQDVVVAPTWSYPGIEQSVGRILRGRPQKKYKFSWKLFLMGVILTILSLCL